jgi:hypothetical protein
MKQWLISGKNNADQNGNAWTKTLEKKRNSL